MFWDRWPKQFQGLRLFWRRRNKRNPAAAAAATDKISATLKLFWQAARLNLRMGLTGPCSQPASQPAKTRNSRLEARSLVRIASSLGSLRLPQSPPLARSLVFIHPFIHSHIHVFHSFSHPFIDRFIHSVIYSLHPISFYFISFHVISFHLFIHSLIHVCINFAPFSGAAFGHQTLT